MGTIDVYLAVEQAVMQFLDEQGELLTNDLNERTITHTLANYIEARFKWDDYRVDCEYNKHGKDPKRLPPDLLQKSGELQREIEKHPEIKERLESLLPPLIYPDIIVHERGTDERNLCIIEVKKAHGEQWREEYDKLKLRAYTYQHGDGTLLRYSLGLYIIFDREKERGFEMLLYENGQAYTVGTPEPSPLLTENIEIIKDARIVKRLQSKGIKTFADLIEYQAIDIFRIQGFGIKSLRKLEEFLDKHNLRLN